MGSKLSNIPFAVVSRFVAVFLISSKRDMADSVWFATKTPPVVKPPETLLDKLAYAIAGSSGAIFFILSNIFRRLRTVETP